MRSQKALTEVADEPGGSSAGRPFAIPHTALCVDVEAHRLVPLRKLVETALVIIDQLECLLVFGISVLDCWGKGFEPGVSVRCSCATRRLLELATHHGSD